MTVPTSTFCEGSKPRSCEMNCGALLCQLSQGVPFAKYLSMIYSTIWTFFLLKISSGTRKPIVKWEELPYNPDFDSKRDTNPSGIRDSKLLLLDTKIKTP